MIAQQQPPIKFTRLRTENSHPLSDPEGTHTNVCIPQPNPLPNPTHACASVQLHNGVQIPLG